MGLGDAILWIPAYIWHTLVDAFWNYLAFWIPLGLVFVGIKWVHSRWVKH